MRGWVADGAFLLFAALVVLLAFLPTGVSVTRQTISAYALAPQGDLLRVAFCCLAVGSGFAAFEFWRLIPGWWGRSIAGLIGVWVAGDLIDTVSSVSPVGTHTLHGSVHAAVAVVAFSAVASTVAVFAAWSTCCHRRGRAPVMYASATALLAVIFELCVTAASATFLAGTAERLFFVSALVWMTVARRTVARPARNDEPFAR